MQKVYLLLRNNQQTGPHSFEELLELQLKPFDLIWVEGKSLGWRYPTEIETLKPFFATPEPRQREESPPNPLPPTASPTPVNTTKKIFVSMPAGGVNPMPSPKEPVVDPIEQKAEALRKRVEAFTPQQNPVQTNYSRNLNEVEEDYTQWAYQKKTKKSGVLNKKYLAIACIILLLSGGWWLGSNFFNRPPVINTKTAVVQNQKMEEPTFVDSTEPVEDVVLPEVNPAALPNIAAKKEIEKPRQTEKKKTTAEETILPETIVTHNEPIEKPAGNIISEETEKEKEIIAEAPPAEKKKSLKEKISDLLKKRKPGDESTESTSKKTENNGERSSTHRDDTKQEAPVLTDVSDQVEIRTNKIADSWMMGVKNLKLTLVNNSKLTINSAQVEVLYYSEQKNLLDKKTLSFSNIAPNKSLTLPTPDQRLADHIEYKIISATGVDNAYANN